MKVFLAVLKIYALCALASAACTSSGKGCSCSTTATSGTTTPCDRTGADYSYSEAIASSKRTITTNGCPNHAMADFTPNSAVKLVHTYGIPQQPMLMAIGDAASLLAQGGTVGILLDGSQIYSAYGGAEYGSLASDYSNNYVKSAPYAEGYSFDFCEQHASTGTSPSYHTHVPPPCLLKQLNATTSAASPQLGWAIDGFPVYGPLGPNGVFIKRCTEATADQTYCLDKCGGRYLASGYSDGFTYRYHIIGPWSMNTADKCTTDMWNAVTTGNYVSCSYTFAQSFYPFTPLCLRGCVPTGVSIDYPSFAQYKSLPTCTSKSGVVAGTTQTITATLSALSRYTDVDSCTSTACSGSYPNPAMSACVHTCANGSYAGIAQVCASPRSSSARTQPLGATTLAAALLVAAAAFRL